MNKRLHLSVGQSQARTELVIVKNDFLTAHRSITGLITAQELGELPLQQENGTSGRHQFKE